MSEGHTIKARQGDIPFSLRQYSWNLNDFERCCQCFSIAPLNEYLLTIRPNHSMPGKVESDHSHAVNTLCLRADSDQALIVSKVFANHLNVGSHWRQMASNEGVMMAESATKSTELGT
jgi:hypothetical protein